MGRVLPVHRRVTEGLVEAAEQRRRVWATAYLVSTVALAVLGIVRGVASFTQLREARANSR